MARRARRLPPGVRRPLGAPRVLWTQVGLGAVVVLSAGVLAGVSAAVSAGVGVAVVVLPNAVFALRLGLLGGAGGESAVGARDGVGAFFLGEFLKVGASAAGLVAAALLYDDLLWPALLAGMVVALKSYIVVLLMERS